MIKKNFDKIVILILIILVIIIGYKNKISEKPIEAEKLIEKETETFEQKSDSNKIFVHITGCITKPGVYEIDSNSRLNDLVNLANGFCKDVDINRINLSKKLVDESKIHILKINEENSEINNSEDNIEKSNKININKANKEELQTLPGIGESKALEILKYREKTKFNFIEDIKNISGIGEKTFEKFKDLIVVD